MQYTLRCYMSIVSCIQVRIKFDFQESQIYKRWRLLGRSPGDLKSGCALCIGLWETFGLALYCHSSYSQGARFNNWMPFGHSYLPVRHLNITMTRIFTILYYDICCLSTASYMYTYGRSGCRKLTSANGKAPGDCE